MRSIGYCEIYILKAKKSMYQFSSYKDSDNITVHMRKTGKCKMFFINEKDFVEKRFDNIKKKYVIDIDINILIRFEKELIKGSGY